MREDTADQVRQLTSPQLLQRLRMKGIRNPDHSRALIKDKLTADPDSEISMTSLRVSLICPLGKMRLTVPCRAVTCSHLQCFDAALYLQMNEKKPTWKCPVCGENAPCKSLFIDGLFMDILNECSDADQIEFQKDGSWCPMRPTKAAVKVSSQSMPKPESSTPVHQCAVASHAAAEPGAAGKKVDLIDLTSLDDSSSSDDSSEEEEPDPPVKKRCLEIHSKGQASDLPSSLSDQSSLATIPADMQMMMMVGGATEERPFLHWVVSFNPLTKQWKYIGNVPFNIKNFGVAASGRGADLYLAGGRFPGGSYSRDMWRYDPYHNSWLKLAPMNVARCDLSLVMLDGFVYAVGSDVEGDDDQPLMECYNPTTNTWHCIEGNPEYDLIHAVVALDGLLYIYGDLAYTYNPKTSVWTQVAPIPNERRGFGSSACTLNGKIYVLGHTGLDWHRRKMCMVLCYDPETNEWTRCCDLVNGRRTPGVAVVEGKMYVAGGTAVGRHHPIERYCEDTDTWDIVGEMPTGFKVQCLILRKKSGNT